jgi:thymidine phosphorylase
MDAGSLGMAAVQLGAGRHKADDAINHAVGFSGIRKIGERISKGEPLLVIHAASEADADAASKSVNIEVRTS